MSDGVGEFRVGEDRNFYRPLYNFTYTLQLKYYSPLFDFDFGLRLFTVISRKGRRVWAEPGFELPLKKFRIAVDS